ncbi:MAG: glycosyltransferase family 4 protein [Clostridia bacterium]|nr:glycosyltransferase family 4 protein [Clostridia bacterium]
MKSTGKLENKKIRVLFITNIPSPYNVDYLNELGKLCDVTAVFEQKVSTERDSSWEIFDAKNFKCVVLRGIRVKRDMSISVGVIKYIKKFKNDFDRVVIGNPASPTGIIAINYCKLCKIPFILQSEGGFAGAGKGFKEWFKKNLMSGAKLYLSGMNSDNDYFLAYGGNKDNIFSYPFSSYFQNEILTKVPTRLEKDTVAKELGLNDDYRILYVGSIAYHKGVDVLLRAFKKIENNAHLYMVGGKPNEELSNLISVLDIKNIHFVGFAQKELVRKYYIACDLLVLPTRGDTWGLVINEAMSHGLPIITTKKCVAGNELISDYQNGFLINNEDHEMLHERIMELMLDESLAHKISENNIEKMQQYSLENMAKVIYDALNTSN